MEILLARTSSASNAWIRSVTVDVLLPRSDEPVTQVVEGALQRKQSRQSRFGYGRSGDNPSFKRFVILRRAALEAQGRYAPSPAMLPAMPVVTPEDERHVESVYRRHLDLLTYLAGRRFRIPEEDVRPLVHDVFVSYLRHRERIREERKWLVGAIYNRCRRYWSERGEPVPESARDLLCEDTAAIVERVDLASVIARLPEQCRELLRRFAEGYSMKELAIWLGTNVNNAKQIVHRCKVRARALFCVRRGEMR